MKPEASMVQLCTVRFICTAGLKLKFTSIETETNGQITARLPQFSCLGA
jgi:hypothetical protein